MFLRIRAFTLVEIMIVVAIIGLLACIAIPSFIKSRNTTQQNICINNLRQIDSAKEQAALAYRWPPDGVATTTVVDCYIKGNTTPLCPCSGNYDYRVVGSNPVCSIEYPTSHKLPRNYGE